MHSNIYFLHAHIDDTEKETGREADIEKEIDGSLDDRYQEVDVLKDNADASDIRSDERMIVEQDIEDMYAVDGKENVADISSGNKGNTNNKSTPTKNTSFDKRKKSEYAQGHALILTPLVNEPKKSEKVTVNETGDV